MLYPCLIIGKLLDLNLQSFLEVITFYDRKHSWCTDQGVQQLTKTEKTLLCSLYENWESLEERCADSVARSAQKIEFLPWNQHSALTGT